SIPPKELRGVLMQLAEDFQPDLILTQIQSPQPITAAMLSELRQRTNATIVNWNGDEAYDGLAGKEMLEVLRHLDFTIITNLNVVPTYEQQHIHWQYWQIGYEEPGDDLEAKINAYYQEIGQDNPFRDYPDFPVVYLASLRTLERQQIAEIVRSFGGYVF